MKPLSRPYTIVSYREKSVRRMFMHHVLTNQGTGGETQ